MDGFGDLVDVIEFPGKIMDSVDPTHQLWKKVKKKRKERYHIFSSNGGRKRGL